MQSLPLTLQKVVQRIKPGVRHRQGQQMHFTATGAMHGHGLLNLTPTAFNHLGPTHRTHPDTAAGLQASIASCLVILGLPHLYVLVIGTNTQAFGSARGGQNVASYRLKREAFHPANHGIYWRSS